MYLSLIVSISSSFTHLHGFQVLVQMPQFIEIIFFVCTNIINLLNLKLSSDRLVIVAKGFVKLPNLHMLIQKIPSLPRNLAFLVKQCSPQGKSAILPLFNSLLMLSSGSAKAKLFAKNFDDFLNLSVTAKIVKRVITNLGSSKASGLTVFQYGCFQTKSGIIQTWAPKKMYPKIKRRKRKFLSDICVFQINNEPPCVLFKRAPYLQG